jgi:hypothetical protein
MLSNVRLASTGGLSKGRGIRRSHAKEVSAAVVALADGSLDARSPR